MGFCEGFYFNYIVGINFNVFLFNMKNIFEVIWVNCKKDVIYRVFFWCFILCIFEVVVIYFFFECFDRI